MCNRKDKKLMGRTYTSRTDEGMLRTLCIGRAGRDSAHYPSPPCKPSPANREQEAEVIYTVSTLERLRKAALSSSCKTHSLLRATGDVGLE